MLQAPLPRDGFRVENFWRIVEPEPLGEEIFVSNYVPSVSDGFQTLLHQAVAKGQLEQVERILDSMFFDKKMMAAQDTNERTALHYAAALPSLDIFKTLIEHPFATADIVALKDSNGQTALDIIADRPDIDMLDQTGFSKDIWEKRDAFGQTILHRNMLRASLFQIKRILSHPFMNARIFDTVNAAGQTALHLAALRRDPEILDTMLSHPFITPQLIALKDKHGVTAEKSLEQWPDRYRTNHMVELRIRATFNQFKQVQQKLIERFTPPKVTESGLHFKDLVQCFYPNDYPYLSFAPILKKPKRPDQIRIFGKNLAANLHQLKAVLDTVAVHHEKNFRVEVRYHGNLHHVIIVNQENWFGIQEHEIFNFETIPSEKLSDFIGILWGSPIGVFRTSTNL